MAFNKKKLRQLVEFPSLGALVYQAHFLVQELKRINDEEYPREACIIRDVLLCFAEHIFDELERILAPTQMRTSFAHVISEEPCTKSTHSYVT